MPTALWPDNFGQTTGPPGPRQRSGVPPGCAGRDPLYGAASIPYKARRQPPIRRGVSPHKAGRHPGPALRPSNHQPSPTCRPCAGRHPLHGAASPGPGPPALQPSPTGRPSSPACRPSVKIRRLVQATGPPAAPVKGRASLGAGPPWSSPRAAQGRLPINWLPAVVARPRAGAREQGRPPLQAPGAAGSLDGEV
jgi:hypothetical protein